MHQFGLLAILLYLVVTRILIVLGTLNLVIICTIFVATNFTREPVILSEYNNIFNDLAIAIIQDPPKCKIAKEMHDPIVAQITILSSDSTIRENFTTKGGLQTREILSIVALVALGLCLLCGLAKMAMKSPKVKQSCDYACSLLVFIAVVLAGVSQLLEEEK